MKLTGKRCLCRCCGEQFNSVGAFDKHRTGPMTDRRCLSVDEMRAAGMARNWRNLWVSAPYQEYAA